MNRNAIFNRARHRLGLTLAKAARLVGHPAGAVEAWGSGKRPCPPAVLRVLAAARLLRYRRRQLKMALDALENIQRHDPHSFQGMHAAAALVQLKPELKLNALKIRP